LAYTFDAVKDDGKGGLRIQWRDPDATPTRRVSLGLASDGKLTLFVFDRDEVHEFWESRSEPRTIVQALRRFLL
jgi:hypothetical protein